MRMVPDSELQSYPTKAWMDGAMPPLHTWLQSSQSADDANRLKQVGNIVMPHVANLAVHLLRQIQVP